MNKTSIEYCDFTWNPVTGCTRGCSYCYARRLAHGRLKTLYLFNRYVAPGCNPKDPFSPRFWRERLSEPLYRTTPARIFAVDMGDLWDPHVPPDWIETVLTVAKAADRHTFIFLTKQPTRAAIYDFPPNTWVGVTLTDRSNESTMNKDAFDLLEAPVRFYSIEPFLSPVPNLPRNLDWLVIGAMTGSLAQLLRQQALHPDLELKHEQGKWFLRPPPEWVEWLLDTADDIGIPVFLKDNLDWPERRQEWPKGR